MPSFNALARDRSTFAALAMVLAFAAGPAGPISAAAADDAPAQPAHVSPAATTPATPTTPTTPSTTPVAPTAPALEPSPTPAPTVDPTGATDAFGPVTASAVVLPGPIQVPIAERITPAGFGPSLRFVSAGHRLRAARMKTLNVKFDVAGASSLRAWVILPSQAVKASGVEDKRGALTLARRSVTQPPSGRIVLKLRFDGPAQEALLRFLKVTVTVRLVATDAKGNVKTVEQPVALSD